MTTLVELQNCVFGYGNRPVVEVDSLQLHSGRCLGIYGPNGSGKTTLVRGITGLLPPMRGIVRQEPSLRMGYLPQHRSMQLHWPMTALDAACMAVSARRRFGWIGSVMAQVRQAIQRLEVSDLAERSFSKLSGGQQQRILLAGVLADRPQLLILDEPTDGLDVRSRATLLRAIAHECEQGLSLVLISHERQDLIEIADETIVLDPARPPLKIRRAEMHKIGT